MKRWVVPTAVILTALLCLGTAGYAGQAWWSRRIALKLVAEGDPGALALPSWTEGAPWDPVTQGDQYILGAWYECPSWGWFDQYGFIWVPRRTCREYAELVTGQRLPNAPDAWEAWFKAHPNLVWGPQKKMLRDAPSESARRPSP